MFGLGPTEMLCVWRCEIRHIIMCALGRYASIPVKLRRLRTKTIQNRPCPNLEYSVFGCPNECANLENSLVACPNGKEITCFRKPRTPKFKPSDGAAATAANAAGAAPAMHAVPSAAARTSAATVAPSGLAAVRPAQQQARENTVTERGTHWSFCSSSEHIVVTFKGFHVAVRSATAPYKCLAINTDISCIAEGLNLMQRTGMHLPAFPSFTFTQSNQLDDSNIRHACSLPGVHRHLTRSYGDQYRC